LTLTSEGAKQYADISRARWSPCPSRRTSSPPTLDSRVIVAPRFNEAILDGRASITGGFTLAEARALADQLKFGALPMSFVEQTSIDISPTLGSEQLRYGLLAGLIGLSSCSCTRCSSTACSVWSRWPPSSSPAC
jgi:preprotein translocase subunit SecD